MSKTAILLNGENSSDVEYRADANIDMVSVNDISCAKRLDNFNSKDSGQSLLTYPCEFDHIYASNMSEDEKQKSVNLEITLLKKIVLSQVNLIQHHSLQLVTKDKQISALRQENETLKLRLERMDRRVTLQKHKDSTECTSQPIAHSTPSATTVSQSYNAAANPLITTHALTTLDSSVKTESDSAVVNTPYPARKRKREDNGSICSAASKRTNRSSSWNGVQDRDDTLSIGAASGKINGKSSKRDISHRRRRKRRLKNGDESKRDNKNILLTDIQYYTSVGDEETVLDLNDVPQVNGCVLEVPCWRTKLFTSCYSMEGTENLSEDVFERRHSRLEIDERRRKRWDVQRIREQRQLEKLRQRERRNNTGDDCEELTSLWPLSEDVEHVEVSTMLPVAAFGYPIPNFSDSKPIEFSLPWMGFDKSSLNNTNSRLRQNTTKQKEKTSLEPRSFVDKLITVDQKKRGK